MNVDNFKYQWFTLGDINAAIVIIFDNLAILTFITLILQFGYHMPADIIITHMIPGTVVGVLIGNILCMILGFYKAYREKRQVIAIPLGIDAPSGIGFAVCILGPAYIFNLHRGLSAYDASIIAWHIGSGALFFAGVIKLFFSLFIKKIKLLIPSSALLGAVGGVAIAFIGFVPLTTIIKNPIIGFTSLIIILLTMFAKIRLPFNLSGISSSIIVGSILYYLLILLNLNGTMPELNLNIQLWLPLPSVNFFDNIEQVHLFLPLVVPFALLVVFGSIAVTESADCVGEHYNVRHLALIDATASIISSFFGGVAQTTPYAGFPAYKKLEARSGYLLINILVVGIGGIFGFVGFIVHLIPEAAVAPVLLFVAFEIMSQGFIQCDKKYIPALLFAFLPSIARLLQIKLTDGSLMTNELLQTKILAIAPNISDQLAIIILGNGFIITGILWGSLFSFIINQQLMKASITCIILSVMSYFGIIHSVFIDGHMYLPFYLPQALHNITLQLSLGYFLTAIVIFIIAQKEKHSLLFKNQ